MSLRAWLRANAFYVLTSPETQDDIDCTDIMDISDPLNPVITGGGVSTSTTLFSESIPFNGASFMSKTVDGPLEFIPDATGRITGGSTYLRLIADGTNIPTFDDSFVVTSGSYSNTAGMVNRLIFFWNGYEYELSIAQLGIIDITPPTIVSAEATDANTIVLVFSEPVNGTDAGWSFDNGSALTINGVTGSGTDTWSFDIDEDMTDADTITYDYSGGDVEDEADNALAGDSGIVTNNIPSNLVPIDFSNNNNSLVESPAGTWSSVNLGGGVGDLSLAGNGYFQVEITSLVFSDTVAFALDAANTINVYSAFDYGIYNFSGGYYATYAGNSGENLSVACNVGDLLRISRTGSVVIAELSTNSGASWTTIKTFAATTLGVLYPKFDFVTVGATRKVVNPLALGMV